MNRAGLQPVSGCASCTTLFKPLPFVSRLSVLSIASLTTQSNHGVSHNLESNRDRSQISIKIIAIADSTHPISHLIPSHPSPAKTQHNLTSYPIRRRLFSLPPIAHIASITFPFSSPPIRIHVRSYPHTSTPVPHLPQSPFTLLYSLHTSPHLYCSQLHSTLACKHNRTQTPRPILSCPLVNIGSQSCFLTIGADTTSSVHTIPLSIYSLYSNRRHILLLSCAHKKELSNLKTKVELELQHLIAKPNSPR